ncbi:MAG: DUF3298 and DUF4163 domain-containing protein [bacterium]|nr:DUF3298 and DUF4163 domain-containing protein [bacterium]
MKCAAWILGAVLIFVPACKGKKAPQFEFETIVFEKSYRDCKPESKDCTRLKLIYPKVVMGGNDGLRRKFNEVIMKWVETPFFEKESLGPEALAQKMFSKYAGFQKEFPTNPIPWELQRTVSAEQVSPGILNLDSTQYSFMGGAHPNTFRILQSFNATTAEAYSLADLFKPGYEADLTKIGEKIFRKQMNVPPGENLGEAGFFFEKDVFKLNENFQMAPGGLKFFYNPYEVAPYVVGPIELIIPWAELKGLLKEYSPAAYFLNEK